MIQAKNIISYSQSNAQSAGFSGKMMFKYILQIRPSYSASIVFDLYDKFL